ncbi:MAG: superoxide dismutase family protein [Dehalococcoidia bacterium]
MSRVFKWNVLAVVLAALAPALLATVALAGTSTPSATPSPSPSPSPTAAPTGTATPMPTLPPTPSYAGPAVASATAELKNASGQVVGSAQFSQDASGVVLVKASFSGVEGAHGMHIHTVGKCDAPDFTSAGGHFNPTGKKHGLLNADGPHAGDLPEITVSSAGAGSLETTTNRISLTTGATSIFDADGSALVIHAGHDDQVTDPTGNSGARLACGLIVAPAALPSTGGSPDDGGTNLWLLMTALTGAAVLAAAAAFAALRRLS